MQAFSLSLESMASRSLLHDMGMQQPKIIQLTAWKGPSDQRAAAAALRALWQSPSLVHSWAKFGLLAANTNVESGEEWDALSAELSESRCAGCMPCCLATTVMQPDNRYCMATCMSWGVCSVLDSLTSYWLMVMLPRCAVGPMLGCVCCTSCGGARVITCTGRVLDVQACVG